MSRKNTQYSSKLTLIVILLIVGVLGTGGYIFFHNKWHGESSGKPVTASSKNIDEPLAPNFSKSSTNEQTMPPSSSSRDYVIPPIIDGLAPVLSTIPTKQKVVFLGIDDGANKQPFELQLVKTNHIKASLFLSNLFIQNNPAFFKDFITAGSLVEDHTVNHRLLSHMSYAEQKKEICDEADLELQQFGRHPVLFRPPGGDYNQDTRRATAACGMQAVVLWIAKANGGSIQYQIGHSLSPGDIVLMHFRPEFAKDMQAFVDAEKAAGLHTVLLEDWLQDNS